ncbi:MAG: methyltransferase domain-containing protein [Pseudomonadota bacterium]
MRVIFSAFTFAVLATLNLAQAAHHEEKAMSAKVILSADYRAKDSARDAYRHPAETLRFFGLKPDMTVAEYGPGGGWYTRILAPYLADKGVYIGVGADVERYHAGADAERNAKRKLFPETFPGRVEEWTGVSGDNILAVEVDEAPESVAGTVDAVLTFRGFHGLARKNMTDETLKHFYSMLKPGGVVGIVQHRAPEDDAYAATRGHRGYLKQSEVIAMFEMNGFELVSTSEINANPKDSADWEKGVWTLPPTLTRGDEDKDKYLAIGESDRMTLLFRKPV